jgi:Reverse transcriptase (RNA-dependent DNA polymerase)
MSNQSAPGHTGIPYIAYKHMGKSTLNFLTELFNEILINSTIPNEWRIGTIYPIPKTTDWEHNINITRPITLLETGKKIFTKCLTTRLNKVMTQHNILSEHNWAALPGLSTREPINIINNIIEEARNDKRELWMMFQDMSKAYDTVDLNILEAAMTRLKIPPNICAIIKNLFHDRKNTVLTIWGNTEPHNVENGID